MDIQKRIKDNVEDFRCILNDMSNWEEAMKRKEISLQEQEDTDSREDLPPIRTKLRKKETFEENVNITNVEDSDAMDDDNQAKAFVEKNLGNEFVKQKKYSDAIHHYTSAIDLYSEDPVFFCNRAQCYLQIKQWENAVNDCDRAVELDSNYVKAHYRKGLALRELKELKLARDHFLKALELEPNNQNLKNDLLLLNESLADCFSNADVNNFENSLTDREKREKSLDEKERGNAMVKQQKWTEAIFHYTEAIKCYSNDATFYCNRALCFLNLKKFKEAETDCTIALQLDAEYVKAYHRRALALKELNQLKEAHENFRKALELDPGNPCIKSDLAKLEKVLNSSSSFETKFEEPKLNDKEVAYAKKEKGNAFVKKKDWNSAIECYTEACRLYPDDISFYLNRALCFLKIKEPKKALLDCTLVLERDPRNVKAYYRRAVAHELLENLSKAHDDFLEAYKLDSGDDNVRNKLNKLEQKIGILAPDTIIDETTVPEITNEPPCNTTIPKRISGEKFIKLGGRFVQPKQKLPHQISTKPLKTIKICDINDDPLKSAFDEINLVEINKNHCAENVITTNCEREEHEQNVDGHELPIPKTFMQFVSSWDKLNSSQAQYTFLKRIKGEDLPRIFKESLESYIFSEILEVLATEFVQADEPVYHYLLGLSNVKRIKALLLFATEVDSAHIRTLLDHIQKREEVSESDWNSLKSFYYC